MSASHNPADTTVLVTGASGFIAQHVILQLLEAGYRVRGTLRLTGRSDEVRAVIAANAPGGADRLELVPADLDEG